VQRLLHPARVLNYPQVCIARAGQLWLLGLRHNILAYIESLAF
jgi:hypothetical protein